MINEVNLPIYPTDQMNALNEMTKILYFLVDFTYFKYNVDLFPHYIYKVQLL